MNKNIVIMSIFIFIIILGLISGIYFSYLKNNNEIVSDTVSGDANDNTISREDEEKGIKKIDETKDIVYTAYKGEYKENGYVYELPFINIDSEDVRLINNEIQSIIDWLKELLSEGFIDIRSYKYEYYINNNVLSVVIFEDDDYGAEYGKILVYNIDIYTGKKLDSKASLEANNIFVTEVESHLKEAYDKVFNKVWGQSDRFNEQYVDYTKYYIKTKIDGNEIYLDENKNVILKVTFPNIAGATGDRWSIINVTQLMNVKEEKLYMIENSDNVEIDVTTGLIANMSSEDLNIAYNEIFARHGHDFKSEELKKYFSNMAWYKPVSGKQVSIEELNEIEKKNVQIIKDEIAKRK